MRIWEIPPISDDSFIRSHLTTYTDWTDKPGSTDLHRISELAEELGISSEAKVIRDYDDILREHRAGNPVMFQTKKASLSNMTERDEFEYSLLLDMDEAGFTQWIPTDNGLDDFVKRDRGGSWDASGMNAIALDLEASKQSVR